ncbi:KEOPS complex subunit Pcc1 [Methanotorris formicicus]|uniref:KEOPS complex Pcc1-like subunit n=1 Tax=Methanotorris formicicus Mc-S-70 TaxID=647171 RepID=H1L032_9EURY|nr:KEOPS complex subunit Pcc1 [Methanotorris formicicus]EHP85252.1 hypothetical protein MetfoDRAFT_1406 [Methanotorris formicicus Mc-S-70]
MKVRFNMNIPTEEEICKSLEVDNTNEGIIIKVECKQNNMDVYIETHTIGSLKNALDDLFANFSVGEDVLKIAKDE